MAKQALWHEIIKDLDENRFDTRTLDKKLDEGVITRQEVDQFLKAIPEEQEADFSSHDELMAEEPEAID